MTESDVTGKLCKNLDLEMGLFMLIVRLRVVIRGSIFLASMSASIWLFGENREAEVSESVLAGTVYYYSHGRHRLSLKTRQKLNFSN
jgi:hypothetical protein